MRLDPADFVEDGWFGAPCPKKPEHGTRLVFCSVVRIAARLHLITKRRAH